MDRALICREGGAVLLEAHTLSLTIARRVRLVAGLDKVCHLEAKGLDVHKLR